MAMNDDMLLRYSRHILLPQVDVAGQEAILAAKVLVIGLGGLGSPAAIYLAASGVGELVLVDYDYVDSSNLQRQVVHLEETIGQLKVDSAKEHLHKINSSIKVTTVAKKLSCEALEAIVENVDVVLDCTDNFATRKLINRACMKAKKPLVSGAAIRLEGQLTVMDFRDDKSPCYECLYAMDGDDDLSCARNGVLSPVVGIVGCSQALETLKIIADFGQPLVGKLGLFDGAANHWRYISYSKNPSCLCCS